MITLSQFQSELSHHLGDISWGYVDSTTPLSYERYTHWLDQNHHGILQYLEDQDRNFVRKTKRQDLKNIFPQAQSALVFLFSYASNAKRLSFSPTKKIASYVTGFEGFDYHHWIKNKLTPIQDYLQQHNISSHQAIDTQAILERDFAYQAGLGWFGKNSMLINRHQGSYVMIAILILDQKLPFSKATLETDHCGSCQRCVIACPTNAIDPQSRTLIANRCISTFTIELFKPTMPAPPGMEKTDYIFGCDICQDVCPWNEKKLKQTADLLPVTTLMTKIENINSEDLKKLTNRSFKKDFHLTALERTGRIGILKNFLNNSF